MRNRFDEDGNPDLRVVVAQYRDAMQKRMRWVGPAILGVVVLLLMWTGVYSVDPGEVAVVRTFGKETGQTQPGLHFAIPIVQEYTKVNISQIRRVEIGFLSDQAGASKRIDGQALMLTGDENIVEAQMIVQYQIADPSKYLFKLKEPDKVLEAAAEVALRGVVGQVKIDDVLTVGREQAQVETKEKLQELMDLYESGLRVTEVKLQEVDAPDEVKDAFHDVVRAREEKQQKINEAQGYEADQIPRARGEAQKTVRAAEGYKEQRIKRAAGDASNFEKVLVEYEKARDITRERLHLETMERVLTRVPHKVLVDESVAKGALPILPLLGGARDVTGGAP